MSYESIGQQGVNNHSTPGAAGPNSLRDDNFGNAEGDTVENAYSRNDVKAVSFLRTRNLQGAGTTFYYPYGRSQQQEY
jgi:hypothetical protein